MMALASVADGTSVITETVYHDRFTHVPELRRLGANIELDGNVAVILGRPALSGAHVMATKLALLGAEVRRESERLVT
jgi:UDP-N-acetylglucosamine 1-carboxyvinyltransferase